MRDALAWVGAAYATVLAAELLGDRSLFAVGALAARYGSARVLAGVVPAFMGKALAAVLLGRLLAGLPSWVVASASASTFGVAAIVLWRERDEAPAAGDVARAAGWPAVLTAFSSVFFTEWADPGQLAAAATALESHAPLGVWLGATLALSTKGLLAVTLGRQVGRRVPRRVLRRAAVALCLGMGMLALLVPNS
ncbi:protein of unknown function UPF0016 (plasmid) [Gemmatirosa kalamazoonensis]|uniref:GDT1 family protein n=1 Tax=Gemmatirosa kalamazoonensis TaxID=861299 RepID=W0RPB0_9BACT|nr:TMEM165/GDT1 family protein [Gemmatirosa kalamazoonensis]AHG92322.1 protein of unknown function UPF0016 [Gemmatirosa kalamazoonensis]